MNCFDFDRALQLAADGYFQGARLRRQLGWRGAQWQPGQPLKLLLVGYNGARNMGADVRVTEIIRQLGHVLGIDNVDLTVTTLDPELTRSYFPRARQIRLPKVFPAFIHRECPKHHGVVACEGSMFKSKFADALSTMMAQSLGMATHESKLSVGYGAEAGTMSASLSRFVKNHCREAYIICRNEPSRNLLSSELNIRNAAGTDTAWTFEPARPQVGAALLRHHGWDGNRAILVDCPINPFWWPVKPSLGKFFVYSMLGRHRLHHYSSIYFHHHSDEAEYRYQRYLDAMAQGIRHYTRQRDVFPIIVGMERLDRPACEGLAERPSPRPPLFVSDNHDMHELVSVLRHGRLLVSCRYHAIVTTMPALIPYIGVTIDERIRYLMHERGHAELLLEADDPALADKLLERLFRLEREEEAIATRIGHVVSQQLQRMGRMGLAFIEEIKQIYPAFPLPNLSPTWHAHLPPLSPALQRLLERFS
jgi:polysaccharide pyruvyl transferase WcaK-like protein